MKRAGSTHGAAGGAGRRGFTLVEVLVALAVMALMAALTWRGIDGITRAQAANRQSTDDTLALQAGLTQWRADLDAIASWPVPLLTTGGNNLAPLTTQRSLAWNGSTLRLTRSDAANPAAGLRVVAWTRQSATGWWLRWQSAPLTTMQAWAAAWDSAARWSQDASMNGLGAAAGDGAQAVAIIRVSDWQLYYFRNNAWTNPLSSPAGNASAALTNLPDGVRLLLTLAPGQGIAGQISVDWVRPTFTGSGT
ncbi:MAG: prepilin-type N-terminal cleavage/methylation domain-containing protein [Burkholderiaceae bacterium]|jgi:general secretion pathway protein J|nr:prepilin-type N-terminal cleavage/methylation domain-containing protein [Burkholderiaceae bacterium]